MIAGETIHWAPTAKEPGMDRGRKGHETNHRIAEGNSSLEEALPLTSVVGTELFPEGRNVI